MAKLDRGRCGYYLEHLAEADLPGAGLLERPGRFAGRLAVQLGLGEATVGRLALERLLDGCHPATGERLHPAAGRVQVAAFDLTFAAPKSVSLLYALGPDEVPGEVAAAHHRAVEDALGYLEENAAALRRRVEGRERQVRADGLLVAAFVHRTSRASEPHLHTHALVANLAVAGGDARALDARPLYLHLRTASALYDAGLRDGLRRSLGVAFRARAAAFEVAGLPDRLLEGFSTRHHQIEEALAASGRTGARAAALAALRTRPPKDRSRGYDELVEGWRAKAHRLGVSDGRFAGVLGPPERRFDPGPGRASPAVSAAGAAFEGPFTRRHLLEAAARRLRGGATASELEAAADTVLASAAAEDRLGERPARLAGQKGPLPAGRLEAHYRTARLRSLEAGLAAALAGLPTGPASSPTAGAAEGIWRPEVASLVPSRHLESLAALAERARAAVGEGMVVRAHAPSGREAAAFAALTGIPTQSGDRLPLPSSGVLTVVVAADRQPMAALAGLLAVGRARSAPLLLLVGPSGVTPGTATRELLVPAARPVVAPAWRVEDLTSRGPSPEMLPAKVTRQRLEEAVGAALEELARRRRVGEEVLLVAPDPASAAELGRFVVGLAPLGDERGRAVGRLARVVSLGALGERLDAGGVDALVVLGPAPSAGPLPPFVEVRVDALGPLTRPSAERVLRVGPRRGAERHLVPYGLELGGDTASVRRGLGLGAP